MNVLLGNKVLKKKKIDKDLLIKVTLNESNNRIFVEFSSSDGKLIVQKNYQNTLYGRRDSEEFQESIRSIDDLRNYFKIKK